MYACVRVWVRVWVCQYREYLLDKEKRLHTSPEVDLKCRGSGLMGAIPILILCLLLLLHFSVCSNHHPQQQLVNQVPAYVCIRVCVVRMQVWSCIGGHICVCTYMCACLCVQAVIMSANTYTNAYTRDGGVEYRNTKKDCKLKYVPSKGEPWRVFDS